jgi:hypothetical protein
LLLTYLAPRVFDHGDYGIEMRFIVVKRTAPWISG